MKRKQTGSIYRRAGSPRYQGKYRCPTTGKLKRVTLRTTSKVEARKRLDTIIAEAAPTPPAEEKATAGRCMFQRFANLWLDWYRSKAITSGRKHKAAQLVAGRFMEAFGHMRIADITDADINRYLNGRLETAAYGTVRIERQYLSQIWKRAIRAGVVRFNLVDEYQWPVGASTRKEEKETLTMAQFKEVLAQVKSETDRNVLTLFALTGARKQELADATHSDVIVNGDGLTKLVLRSSKTGKTRKLPLAPQALECIEALREDGRATILPRAKINHWYRTLKAAAAAAGYSPDEYRVNVHGLRHAFCSHWANRADCPLVQLQEWAGHSNIAVTSIYVRRDESKADRLMASMVF